MDTTGRSRATEVVGAISMVLGLIVALLAVTVAPALGAPNTCATFDGGSYTKYEAGTSGDWGSITFSQDDGPLELTVNEGWEVDLCLKKGTEPIHAPGNPYGEGSYSINYGDAGDDGFSHYGIRVREIEEPAGFVCDAGEVRAATDGDSGLTVYETAEEAAADEACTEQESTSYVCDAGEVREATEGDSGLTLYETEEEAAGDSGCAPEELSVFVCSNEEVNELTTQEAIDAATGTLYETSEAAAADPGCLEVAPSAWVCTADGEVAQVTGQQAIDEAEIAGASVHATQVEAEAAEGCQEVLGIVEERDPDPEPAPEPEAEQEQPAPQVKGEQVVAGGQLPNTGAEHVILGLFAGGLLMLGGAMLLLGDRRRRVLA